jgi:hypothetical protein
VSLLKRSLVDRHVQRFGAPRPLSTATQVPGEAGSAASGISGLRGDVRGRSPVSPTTPRAKNSVRCASREAVERRRACRTDGRSV